MKKSWVLLLSTALFFIQCKKDDLDDFPIDPGGSGEWEKIYEFEFNEQSGMQTHERETGAALQIKTRNDEVNRMEGVQGKALFFDGLSMNVEGELYGMEINGNLSISLWAAIKSYPLERTGILAMKSENSDTGFSLTIDKFGKLTFRYFANGIQRSRAVSTEKLSRHQWEHIFIQLNTKNGEIDVSIDNKVVAQTTAGPSLTPWTKDKVKIYFGQFNSPSSTFTDKEYFSGSIDEVKIYVGKTAEEDVAGLSGEFQPLSSVTFNTDFSSIQEDPNRPIYHPIPDYGWTNEPNGLIYYEGEYHMFYQKNDVFMGIAQQNWGHMKSDDLVIWEDLNSVLWPEENSYDNFGTWAGSSSINDDGDPVIMYTGVDGTKATMAIATSYDGMETFEKYENNPVVSAAPDDVNMDFRDPFIWKENGFWHMIVGSGIAGQGGNVVHYATNDLYNWENSYQGVLFQGNRNDGQGEFWEVPIMHKFPNGKYLLLVQKTPDKFSPARTFYWIGNFTGSEFIPAYQEPRNFEIINGFLSPTVTKDENGVTSAIGIIPDEVDPALQEEGGWAHLFSLPQEWTLSAANKLEIKPHPELMGYRQKSTDFNLVEIIPGTKDNLNGASGRHLEIEAKINTGNSSKVGFVIGASGDGREKLLLYLDIANQEWVIDASESSLDSRAEEMLEQGLSRLHQMKSLILEYL